MAKELSKTHRVFFIDNPFTHFMLAKNVLARNKSPYRREYSLADDRTQNFIVKTPPYVFSINWLSYGATYRALLRYNNRLIFNYINRLVEKYKIKDYIFVNVFNPFYHELDRLKYRPLLSVYYSVDEIGLSPYLKKHGPAMEEEVPGRYDLLLSTSRELNKKFAAKTPKARYLPNGADTDLFKINPNFVPPEIAGIKSPIVTFTGHIDWRMDLGLMVEVIRSCPDFQFVFVGPVSLKPEQFELLSRNENVLLVGSKHINDLPSFLYNSACAIIPFKRNDLTKNIYPLKINEYLAAGVPVVSTPFSEDIDQFSDVIHLADNAKQFQEMIRESILTNSPEKATLRVQRADQNRWSERTKKFWEYAEEAIENLPTGKVLSPQ